MAKRRLLLKEQTAVYHVMNRLVRKEFWLDGRCRDAFVRLLRRQAAFAGIEVITYCVMSNHFHLLVRVPPSALLAHREGRSEVDDATLMARYRAFYGKRKPLGSYSADELEERLRAGGAVAEAARVRVLARMGDLSVFMRELKYSFIAWFNDAHDNEGTIWAAKFKSVLLEDVVEVCAKVAAYVDLNPVRAGMVADPSDYRWSGYAAAMGGQAFERQGVRSLLPGADDIEAALATYRRMLEAIHPPKQMTYGELGERDVGADAAREEAGTDGVGESLLRRWRFLAEARVIGTKTFLDALFAQDKSGKDGRGLFSAKRRVHPKELPPSVFKEICAVVRGKVR